MKISLLASLFFAGISLSQSQEFPGGAEAFELLPHNRALLENAAGTAVHHNVGTIRMHASRYLIINCGVDAGSNGVKLAKFLVHGLPKIERLVKADAEKGTASRAFNTFFKATRYASQVASIFTDMVLGIDPPFEVGSNSRIKKPILFCPTEDKNIQGMWDYCKVHPQLKILAGVGGGNYLFLCDSYFTDTKPAISQCPHVRNSRYYPDDSAILDTQFAQFIQGMASLYLQVNPSYYGINDAISLDAPEAVKSPAVYAYYAQCKLLHAVRFHYTR